MSPNTDLTKLSIEDKYDALLVAVDRFRDMFADVRQIARKAARSGHPGLRDTGESILRIMHPED